MQVINEKVMKTYIKSSLLLATAILVFSTQFTSILYALPKDQANIYRDGITDFDVELCGTNSSGSSEAKEPTETSQNGSTQELAKQMLENDNITYWTNNGVNTKDVVVELSKGKKGSTTAPDGQQKSADVNPNILKFILDVAKEGKIMVNALTDKDHSSTSNHYKGQAVDIDKNPGNTTVSVGRLIEIAGKYDGVKNSESDHHHFDFTKVPSNTSTSKSTESESSDNTKSGNVTYKAKGNIPKSGKTYIASVYGTTGSKDSKGKYVENLSGMEGGPNDEKGRPLKGRAVVAEMSGNTALGSLPYGEKIEITYKNKSIVAEVSDNGPGAGDHSDVDLWREVADLLEFPYGKHDVTIRGVDNSTPTTPVDGTASTGSTSPEKPTSPGCVCKAQDPSTAKLAGSQAEEKIYNFYVSSGYTPVQAAGFVGNYYQESKYDPTLVNSIGATGLAQWLGGRLTALKNFASGKNKPHTDMQTQLEFSIKELDGSESAAKSSIKAITGSGRSAVEQVTYIIRTQYERPGEHEANDATRIRIALQAFEKYGDGSGGAVVSSTEPTTNCNDGGKIGPEGSGVSSGKLAWPIESKYGVSSCYGTRALPGQAPRLHGGIDISAPAGTPIKAADGGTVEIAGSQSGFGNTVVIKHSGGLWTLYGNMKDGSIAVRQGQKVDAGQKIGEVNNTGASFGDHLHFNVQTAGGASYANAKDPLKFLPKDPSRKVSGTNCPSSLG